MPHWADAYIARHDGPIAIVRACKVPGCRFALTLRKVRNGGRGWGMRKGNKQSGAIIQHIKTTHPELSPLRKRTELASDTPHAYSSDPLVRDYPPIRVTAQDSDE